MQYADAESDIFTLTKTCTTAYGLNSFSQQAEKSWKALPNQYCTVRFQHLPQINFVL